MPYTQSSPEVIRWCALFISVICLIPASQSIFTVVQGQRTGVVMYSSNPRLPGTERISRETSPDKFQQAITAAVMHSATFGGISLVAFLFFRRLSE
jgi:hypothetical protein